MAPIFLRFYAHSHKEWNGKALYSATASHVNRWPAQSSSASKVHEVKKSDGERRVVVKGPPCLMFCHHKQPIVCNLVHVWHYRNASQLKLSSYHGAKKIGSQMARRPRLRCTLAPSPAHDKEMEGRRRAPESTTYLTDHALLVLRISQTPFINIIRYPVHRSEDLFACTTVAAWTKEDRWCYILLLIDTFTPTHSFPCFSLGISLSVYLSLRATKIIKHTQFCTPLTTKARVRGIGLSTPAHEERVRTFPRSFEYGRKSKNNSSLLNWKFGIQSPWRYGKYSLTLTSFQRVL